MLSQKIFWISMPKTGYKYIEGCLEYNENGNILFTVTISFLYQIKNAINEKMSNSYYCTLSFTILIMK